MADHLGLPAPSQLGMDHRPRRHMLFAMVKYIDATPPYRLEFGPHPRRSQT